MEQLNDQEYKMVEKYKKSKDENIALYFFNKFNVEITNIVFYKINKKFSSIPFEKGDLFHLVWKSIIKTMNEYKNNIDFNASLIKNCYFLTIKEVKKFLNNNELTMNISSSYEGYLEKFKQIKCKNGISKIELPRKVLVDNLIDDVCNYVNSFSQPTIKRVIYLKSQGFTTPEIAKKLRLSRYTISNIMKVIEKIVKKIYF